MNFMYTLREKYARFMAGRYGTDTLNRFLAVMYLVLVVLGVVLRILTVFLPFRGLSIARLVLYYISLAMLAYSLFRTFSRNINSRVRENERFMLWWGRKEPWFRQKVQPKWRLFVRKARDRDHVYKKCPDCKSVLRLSRQRGKHKTRCPACGRQITVRVWFGDKYVG